MAAKWFDLKSLNSSVCWDAVGQHVEQRHLVIDGKGQSQAGVVEGQEVEQVSAQNAWLSFA